jgi:DNA-binding GntR family transcriptional regulator
VASWTSQELREIFEVRLRLEPYAVCQAIPRLSPAELDELCGLAQKMLVLGRDQAAIQIAELNQRFHGLLITRAGNPALASALTSITYAVVVRRNFQNYSSGALARSGHQERGVDTRSSVRGGNAASHPGNVGGVR